MSNSNGPVEDVQVAVSPEAIDEVIVIAATPAKRRTRAKSQYSYVLNSVQYDPVKRTFEYVAKSKILENGFHLVPVTTPIDITAILQPFLQKKFRKDDAPVGVPTVVAEAAE